MNHLTLSVCPLNMKRRHEGDIVASAIGTGFLWKANEQWCLITNWHNVTGEHPETGKLLSGFIPNEITLSLKILIEERDGQKLIGSQDKTIELYKNDEPVWLEHKLGKAIDCVAVPLDFSVEQNLANKPLNEYDFHAPLEPYVGMDCFVIGYPKGLMGRVNTPIWKRASIATEPLIDHDRKPLFLIDTASRKGMSGSPVIARHSGIYGGKGGAIAPDTILGTVENFIGIYSGRVDDDELGIQIGRVWKASVIDEILAGDTKISQG